MDCMSALWDLCIEHKIKVSSEEEFFGFCDGLVEKNPLEDSDT